MKGFLNMRDVIPRRFNKLVTVEQPVTVVDSTTNESKTSFTDLCRAWCSIEPMGGTERLNAHAVESDSTHKIGMYWNRNTNQITSRHRLRMDVPDSVNAGSTVRYFNIVNVNNIEERNRLLMLSCKEQTA